MKSQANSSDQVDQLATPVLTGKYEEIEARCLKAFQEEDGYGKPSLMPDRYRVFRDGFYAAWDRAREDLRTHAASGGPLVTQQQSEGSPVGS